MNILHRFFPRHARVSPLLFDKTINQIEEAQGKSALPPPPAKSVSDVVKAEAAPIGKWEPVPPPDATGASSAAREGGGASAGHEGGIGAGVFGVGARVEVLSGDKWYPAVRWRCCRGMYVEVDD